MCGITGYFNNTGVFDPYRFARANNIVKHRGPDDFGYITLNRHWNSNVWIDESMSDFKGTQVLGALGFRRLSIIDLSQKGHQPMCDHTKKHWVVFNGEIYNYIELRSELISLGYTFHSDTDTEVILNAYLEWGFNCLQRFNGMWAFCILDTINKRLFCARDRFGIKPFYYYADDHTFTFGSEIKQLLELKPNANALNERLVFDFLALSTYGNETNETYFTNIKKLNPGCYFEVVLNLDEKLHIKETNWWKLPNIETTINENELYEKIHFLLADSVKLRLRSDVPQGTALSGGLDSSIIVRLVDFIRKGDAEANKVLTITSDDPAIDDKYYADLVVNNLAVSSFQKKFEDNANLNELERLLWHQEEPIQTASIFGSWELYKYFREQDITVALDGQGADELFYGYNNYPFRNLLVSFARDYGLKYINSQIKQISETYKSKKLDIYIELLYGILLKTLKNNSGLYHHLKLKGVRDCLENSYYKIQKKNSLLITGNFIQSNLKFNSESKKQSYILLMHTNLPGILRQVDRNSMAFSVEARLPFLDYRFAELAYSIKSSLMFKNGYTKYPLRKSMEGKLLEEVLWRKNKIGFKMPEYEVLKKNKDYVMAVLSTLKGDNRINIKKLEKNAAYFLESRENYNNIVWRFFIYALWKKQFNIS